MALVVQLGDASPEYAEGVVRYAVALDTGENPGSAGFLTFVRGPAAASAPGWACEPRLGWVTKDGTCDGVRPEDHDEIFVVFNNAVPGREDEYARWYDEVHLADSFEHIGFVGAQRFALTPRGAPTPYGYLTVYAVPVGRRAVCEARRLALAEDRRRAAAEGRPARVPVTDAVTTPRYANYFVQVSDDA